MSENNEMNNSQWEDPTPKAKAKGKGPLIGIAAIGLAAVVGIGVYASGILGGMGGVIKPEQVSDAMVSLFEGEQNKFMDDWIGGEQLSKNTMKAVNYSGNLELVELPALQESLGMTLPKGIMLSMEGASDSTTKTGSGKLSVGLMGTNFLSAEFFGSDTKMQMAVPAMFKEVITADMSGDLATKIKNAPLLKNLGSTEETEQAIKMFVEGLKSGQAQSDRIMKMINGDFKLDEYKGLVDNTKNFKDKWVIEKAEDKAMLFNGKQETFKGATVTIKKADYITFLKDMKTYVLTDAKFKADFMDMIVEAGGSADKMTKEEAYAKLDQEMTAAITKLEAEPMAKDLTFTIHMTKDNKLVSMTSAYEANDAKVNLLIERNGGDFLNQNAKMTFSVVGGENPGSIELTSTGKTEANVQTRQITMKANGMTPEDSGAITVDSSFNKDTGAFNEKAATTMMMDNKATDLEMVMNGKFENIVKDKSGAMVFDEIKITMDKKVLVNFKGEFKYNTENVVVKPLEGTPMDIFTATENDLNNLMEQIQSNLGGLMNLIGLPLGF